MRRSAVEPQGSFLFMGGGTMSEQDVARLLANRLPLWATALISFLTGTIGWLIR